MKTRKPGWGCGGGLSPPAALNSAFCGSPGGSIADLIDSGRIDFVLESPPHPWHPCWVLDKLKAEFGLGSGW